MIVLLCVSLRLFSGIRVLRIHPTVLLLVKSHLTVITYMHYVP